MSARRLFFRSAAPAGPRRKRAYVIGDVHGCLELLEALLKRIEAELGERPVRNANIVFLGDLIDRGPASAQVVEHLRTYRPGSASTHFVMGNHEEVMLRVLEAEEGLLGSWLHFGGRETLQSYGADADALSQMSAADAAAELRRRIPPEHIEFLRSFADSLLFGDYLFVHAGIRPGVALAEQEPADLRWIREPFLGDSSDHGFVVVHGHTIAETVETAPNRIGIDTGAYRSGVLTALVIEGAKRWLIQTGADEMRRPVLGTR